MILADTSAWIEYVRGTGTAVNVGVRAGLTNGSLCTTEPVVMELLAGARSKRDLGRMKQMLARCDLRPVEVADYEHAAELYRTCRRGGDTIRSIIDCLVAAVAIRTGASVLHLDRDYDKLARHTLLRVEAIAQRSP